MMINTIIRFSKYPKNQLFYCLSQIKNNIQKDYYKVLEIKTSASQKQIKQAYHRLAKQYHPDFKKGKQSKFKQINQSYQILSNQDLRLSYDIGRLGKIRKNPQLYQQAFDNLNQNIRNKYRKRTIKNSIIMISIILSITTLIGFGIWLVIKTIYRMIFKKIEIKQNNNIQIPFYYQRKYHALPDRIYTLPFSIIPYTYVNSQGKTLLQIYYEQLYKGNNRKLQQKKNQQK